MDHRKAVLQRCWLDQGAVWGHSADQIRMTFRALHGNAPTTGVVREALAIAGEHPLVSRGEHRAAKLFGAPDCLSGLLAA